MKNDFGFRSEKVEDVYFEHNRTQGVASSARMKERACKYGLFDKRSRKIHLFLSKLNQSYPLCLD